MMLREEGLADETLWSEKTQCIELNEMLSVAKLPPETSDQSFKIVRQDETTSLLV